MKLFLTTVLTQSPQVLYFFISFLFCSTSNGTRIGWNSVLLGWAAWSVSVSDLPTFISYMLWMDSSWTSVTQLCPTLCDPLDCIMPGFPVHHQIPELAQTLVHWIGDAIQPHHPLPSPSPAFNLAQHQDLFWWVSSSHQVAKVLEFQLQHKSFQWIFRTDFL